MSRRADHIEKIQALSVEEGARQPAAADWLWAQDKAGRESANPDDANELDFWARSLNVTSDEIRAAIEVVGCSLDAIRAHLRL